MHLRYFVPPVLRKHCHLSLLLFAFLNPKALINVSSTAMPLRLDCKCWQHCNTLIRWIINNMTQFPMIYNQLQRAMPRLGRLVVGFSRRRPSFDPSVSPCGDPWWIKWHWDQFTSVVPWLHTRTFNSHRHCTVSEFTQKWHSWKKFSIGELFDYRYMVNST
jgi:hypothetical protein